MACHLPRLKLIRNKSYVLRFGDSNILRINGFRRHQFVCPLVCEDNSIAMGHFSPSFYCLRKAGLLIFSI